MAEFQGPEEAAESKDNQTGKSAPLDVDVHVKVNNTDDDICDTNVIKEETISVEHNFKVHHEKETDFAVQDKSSTLCKKDAESSQEQSKAFETNAICHTEDEAQEETLVSPLVSDTLLATSTPFPDGDGLAIPDSHMNSVAATTGISRVDDITCASQSENGVTVSLTSPHISLLQEGELAGGKASSLNVCDPQQLQTLLLALHPQQVVGQATINISSLPHAVVESFINPSALASSPRTKAAVTSQESTSDGINAQPIAVAASDEADGGNLEVQGQDVAENSGVSLNTVHNNGTMATTELMSQGEEAKEQGQSDNNLLNTLQAEMIAVEVLSQTATSGEQQNTNNQSGDELQSADGNTQASIAQVLNSVNLVQTQGLRGVPVYTVQIGGQTIPLTAIQLPVSQSSGGDGSLASSSTIPFFGAFPTTAFVTPGLSFAGSNGAVINSAGLLQSSIADSATSVTTDTVSTPGQLHQDTETGEARTGEKGKYTCNVCGKSYIRSWSYYGHMREHASGDKNHKCEICGKIFSYASNLKQHMITHTGEKPFECEQCDKAFSNASALRIHALSHSEDKPFVCDSYNCGKAFNNPSSLRVHQRVHQKEKPFKCDEEGCTKSFKTASELSRHAFRHTGEKPHKCDKCDKAFVRYDDLKRHYYIHTGEKPFKCDQCDFACIQSFDLVKHKYTHGGDKPYKCDHCDKQFTRPARLREHMRLHTGEKPYECEDCGKAFTQQTSLKSHRMTHTGEKPFKCEICDKSFTAISDLRSHMNNHTGQRPYKCELCQKEFISAKTLKRHAIVHSGEKPFACNECGRKFARSSDLKVHLPVHSEDKPYKCGQCEKMFTRFSTLKEHVRTHTGEYPFKCQHCDKIFNHRSHLNVHIRIHTGERPYRCDICERDFARKSSLRYHMRIHIEDGSSKESPLKGYDDESNDFDDDSSLMDSQSDNGISKSEAVRRKRKRLMDDDGVSVGSPQKRVASEQQVMANAVEAMQMMANISSNDDSQLQDGDATVTVVSNPEMRATLPDGNQVIITQLTHGTIPLMTSQGTAVVTVDLSDLQGSEGQVVETLVQLQGLEAQVGLQALDGQTLIVNDQTHQISPDTALQGTVELRTSEISMDREDLTAEQQVSQRLEDIAHFSGDLSGVQEESVGEGVDTTTIVENIVAETETTLQGGESKVKD